MKINYILTLILVFCIGASIPVLTGSSQVTEQHSAKSEVPYCVTSPTNRSLSVFRPPCL